ncbi:hypothetical protein LCGC14_0539920 [marine sediment metagenome]|uniref:Uncharacterized protein n=1 Tax=marine sediment metagenome TaxID=412755 RepID=A0A0F9RT85_9ZZZZ
MNFTQKISAGVKKQLSNLKSAYDQRVKNAEVRAQAKIALARTKQERELALLQLQRDKIALKKELYEARIATKNAAVALKKARLEAGDLTISERLAATYKAFMKSQKQPRRSTATKRKTSASAKKRSK